MAFEVFGFEISRNGVIKKGTSDVTPPEAKNKSFAPPEIEDGAFAALGAQYGAYVDFSGDAKSSIELVKKYREMSLHPEVEMAIEDIVNDSIVYDQTNRPVEVVLDNIPNLSALIRKRIKAEFNTILKLLKFNEKGYELFRRWYIDGRLHFHIILNENRRDGILELRPIDPVKIRKYRNVKKKKLKNGVEVVDSVEEFYVYNDQAGNDDYLIQTYNGPQQGVKVSIDSVCTVNSGLYDATKKRVLSYLHKAIKPLNQLRMIEDAVVIYRIARAPERRIFYIDVGNLPTNKAEQYLREIMNRYRNKLVYDATTGEMRDERRHMSMLEDFWLPRREGGKGTEISTLDGGQNLGEMEDVLYFQKKLYQSLHVPTTRLDADNGFNMGRSAEISRDEVKFFRFIERLRKKFAEMFLQLLKTQLIAKMVITPEEWEIIQSDILFDFRKDSYFTELKEGELLKSRLELLNTADAYIGKYFSKQYVKKHVLRFTDDQIKQIEEEIADEKVEIEKQGADPNLVGYGAMGPTQIGVPQAPPQPEAAQEPTPEEQEMAKTQTPQG